MTRALAELSNNRRPRRGQVAEGPRELVPDIYASSELDEDIARANSETARAALSSICDLDWSHGAELVGWAFESPMGSLRLLEQQTYDRQVCDFTVRATSILAECSNGVLVWITHDTNWVYPDDHRLWRVVDVAHSKGVPLLVVARKLSLASFVLFKAIGAYGVQYYSTILPPEQLPILADLERRCGWFHSRHASSLRSHPASRQIALAVSRLSHSSLPPGAQELLHSAKSFKLDNPNTPAEAFVDWADQLGTTASFPEAWYEAVGNWRAWTAYSAKRPGSALFGRKTEVSRIGVRAY